MARPKTPKSNEPDYFLPFGTTEQNLIDLGNNRMTEEEFYLELHRLKKKLGRPVTKEVNYEPVP